MYTATIFTVSIVSPGVTIEEEHLARETLNRWNAENGKEKGKVFLPLPSDSSAETDIYVLPIDNYVDITKVNTIIATSKPVYCSSANTTTKITPSLRNSKRLRRSRTKRSLTA